MKPLFITGIGTGVGKTLVSAIVAEALGACYWKPVQAGYEEGTDTQWIAARLSHPWARVLPEAYKLKLPASPHIAAREEGVVISLEEIESQFHALRSGLPVLPGQSDPRVEGLPGWSAPAAGEYFVIEGAGGLMVPLNDREFMVDLIKKLDARVILVSRNYLGSINHSLLTAAVCKEHGLDIVGWIFNDQYLDYEREICDWSGYRKIGSIPFDARPDKQFVSEQGKKIRTSLLFQLEMNRTGIPRSASS
ncbi:MAG TPA: ATP-dependent dethiobiotin synthetase BioD [Puia sp.]|jgi:dethiobiotin synthetase|nr:ATP-dependent dethiobiotin synthetase BioD [Puia sp.]